MVWNALVRTIFFFVRILDFLRTGQPAQLGLHPSRHHRPAAPAFQLSPSSGQGKLGEYNGYALNF